MPPTTMTRPTISVSQEYEGVAPIPKIPPDHVVDCFCTRGRQAVWFVLEGVGGMGALEPVQEQVVALNTWPVRHED